MLTADYYGKIQILGKEIDGYVLSNGIPCLSELGASFLLGFSTHSVLNNIVSNKGPKEIKSFIEKDLTLSQTVIVTAECRKKNSAIKVYTAQTINTIAKAYTIAYLKGKLRKNQIHIGLHCATLRNALADIALEQMIYESCSYKPQETISKRVESIYIDAKNIISELGFNYSFPNEIAIKSDITKFLEISESTLNSFLYRNKSDIKAIRLKPIEIRSIGSKANRMYAYLSDDVVKITLNMDTAMGIEVKKRLFGNIGSLANVQVKDEIKWQQVFNNIFADFNLKHNYSIGRYRVDFFVPNFFGFNLCLECNGYEHRYYDAKEEEKRKEFITHIQNYALVRFHHKIDIQKIFNGILRAKPGTVIKLECEKITPIN